jgi:hypothetical protein
MLSTILKTSILTEDRRFMHALFIFVLNLSLKVALDFELIGSKPSNIFRYYQPLDIFCYYQPRKVCYPSSLSNLLNLDIWYLYYSRIEDLAGIYPTKKDKERSINEVLDSINFALVRLYVEEGYAQFKETLKNRLKKFG